MSALLIGHGSPDPRHAATLQRLNNEVAATIGRCEIAYLEHNQPLLSEWLEQRGVEHTSEAPSEIRAIGLLLASGYHAQVDIPRTLAAASSGPRVTNLGTLGAGEWIVPVLQRRIADAGAATGSTVVLVAAGSSQDQARADLRATCALLQDHRGGSVLPAAVTGPDPRPEQVIAALPPGASDVVLVPLMLAPGSLADRVAAVSDMAGVRHTPTLATASETPPELVHHLAARFTEH